MRDYGVHDVFSDVRLKVNQSLHRMCYRHYHNQSNRKIIISHAVLPYNQNEITIFHTILDFLVYT